MLPRTGKVGAVGRLLNGATGGGWGGGPRSRCDLGKGSLGQWGGAEELGSGMRRRQVRMLRKPRCVRDGELGLQRGPSGRMEVRLALQMREQQRSRSGGRSRPPRRAARPPSSPGPRGVSTRLLRQLLPRQLSRRCAHLGCSKCHLQDFLF